MAKMGRPKEDNPKKRIVAIRMTQEEYVKFSKAASKHDMTTTQAVKKGIMLLLDSWNS